MAEQVSNPHAGEPFADADEAIAAALDDVCVPALLCSLVHMTGDPAWIRDHPLPRMPLSSDIQGGLGDEQLAELRRKAVPAVAAFRDGGCVPRPLDRNLHLEMMRFLAGGQPVAEDLAAMMVEDMQFDGADHGDVDWGDEVDASTRAATPVVVIGCGLSGILAGIRLGQAGLPFTIIEKNAGPGGTWWENRYPGARVDIGSHQYCYASEPSHHWSEYFCQQPELRDYFMSVVDKYDLQPHCRFRTTVTKLAWDDATGQWHVGIRNPDSTTETLDARFVISSVGSLNLPRLPAIPGMDSFAGPSFHSARWPDGLDLAGKRFVLIGAGATGFQIVPAIADEVEHLTILQRTTQWMMPNPLYHASVPPGERWAMRHLPFYARWFRFVQSYPGLSVGTSIYKIDDSYQAAEGIAINAINDARRSILVKWITSHLADRPDLIAKSIPDYPAMGKRILQDDGSWLRAIMRPNVELVHEPIERIVPEGVLMADGTLYEADIICYATGFRHNEFLASMDVSGKGGVSLREQWGEEPTAYLGITIPNFPNLFCMYGPGTNLAHGASLFFHSECQMHYAMDAIHRVLRSGASTVEVTQNAHDEYADRYRREIGSLLWSHPSIEHSHYKNKDGKIFTLSPWPLEKYWTWTRALDEGHYVIT